MAKHKNSLENVLPPDDVLFDRSKQWAKLFERYSIEEDDYDGVNLAELPEDPDTEEDLDGKGYESVSVSEFEDPANDDDPTFDVKDTLNQTMAIIAKRKQRWEKSGVDRIMDTFNFKNINEKVGKWLQNNPYESYINEEVQFENHRVCVNSEDSIESVDTAKYILENRKKRSSKFTTMTFKRYRYWKGIQSIPCTEPRKKLKDLFEFDERSENGRTSTRTTKLMRDFSDFDFIAHEKDRKTPRTLRRRLRLRSNSNSPSGKPRTTLRKGQNFECHSDAFNHINRKQNRKVKEHNEDNYNKEVFDFLDDTPKNIYSPNSKTNYSPQKQKRYEKQKSPAGSEISFCPEKFVNSTALHPNNGNIIGNLHSLDEKLKLISAKYRNNGKINTNTDSLMNNKNNLNVFSAKKKVLRKSINKRKIGKKHSNDYSSDSQYSSSPRKNLNKINLENKNKNISKSPTSSAKQKCVDKYIRTVVLSSTEEEGNANVRHLSTKKQQPACNCLHMKTYNETLNTSVLSGRDHCFNQKLSTARTVRSQSTDESETFKKANRTFKIQSSSSGSDVPNCSKSMRKNTKTILNHENRTIRKEQRNSEDLKLEVRNGNNKLNVTSSSTSTANKSNLPAPIVIYDPKNSNNCGDDIIITPKFVKKTLGEQITNSILKFNSSSKILYYPPAESDSEADILESFNKKNQILEEFNN